MSSSSSTFQLPPISSLTFDQKQSPQASHSQPSNAAPTPYSNRSCDECRRRKVKCDRRKNFCNQCFRNGLLCTYNDPVLKRGRRPKAQPLPNHRRNSMNENAQNFHQMHHFEARKSSQESLPRYCNNNVYQSNQSPEIYYRNPISLPTPVATSNSTFTPSPPSDPSQFSTLGSAKFGRFGNYTKDTFSSDLNKYSLSSQTFRG
ncbi:hypothetical protein CONCODRAFT_79899 [Conidiobolus coronatus NRRL 28638]|uniref:Zn(2)-C6 fungal-type domain-containing protein n=1 Tax=Conidiobolus coronatus (strain ATCC 28846 / CBS 209.66 / NRRL 28638) TaxID=796925 RepID=A0A137NZU3_CONC2|nr:hypothetical protein CONCODRAFT_79899 [Conidiobolus coronatus NRRL 28638]|eukprot:KXN68124.1 hypothetical protein CONCODRAFT_79899 [Conidiobolus coronatus NRRL 28638]